MSTPVVYINEKSEYDEAYGPSTSLESKKLSEYGPTQQRKMST